MSPISFKQHSYQDNKAFPRDKDEIFRACAEAISGQQG